MTLRIYKSKDQITISIEDRFDFSLHQRFKEAYSECKTQGCEIIIDLSMATYMDSSALGMILLVKDHVEKLSGKLKITNPNVTVNKTLEIAQFHRLITIEK